MSSKIKIFLLLVVFAVVVAACATGGAAPSDNDVSAVPTSTQVAGLPEQTETMPPLPTSTLLPPTMPAAYTATPNDGSGGGGEEPAPTPIAISMDLNTVYQEVIASLPQGSALFNPPKQMRLGEAKTVEVRVVPVTEQQIEEDENVKATLTVDFDTGQEVVIIPLRVSTVMRASLGGEAFTIVPLTAEEQIKSPDDEYLRWLWEVTPERSGQQRLTLTLSVVVNAEGMGDKTHVTTEIREVEVGGNLLYSISRFWNGNWEFVLTGLLFPVIGWGWNKLRQRRKGSEN